MAPVELKTQRITLNSFRLADEVVEQERDLSAPVERGLLPDRQVVFEPVVPDDYRLSYACLIIPRFPAHQLNGDLSRELPEMMSQICFSYGWRLERLTVHPQYLQWILHVSPQSSPTYFMNKIRNDLSNMIFENFPILQKLNLSQDFWAPGYFVIISTQPHPTTMVNEFIRMTRRQQGF